MPSWAMRANSTDQPGSSTSTGSPGRSRLRETMSSACVAPFAVTRAPLASPLAGSSVAPKAAGLPALSKPRSLFARCVVGGRLKSIADSAG